MQEERGILAFHCGQYLPLTGQITSSASAKSALTGSRP